MKRLLFLLCMPFSLWAQAEYPQDYFRSPLDIPIVLSGTFGELRNSHFHAGLDIKTKGQEGLRVYAVAQGYVSRIKISHFGYGKALYITHPNGYTSVYGHLQRLSDRLERYIKTCQYDKERYEVEVFPSPDELPVAIDEIIAFSGNTGGSGGPHLHFEIRDNAERPINPMLFGITTKDSKPPLVLGVFAYPKNTASRINGKNERTPLRLIPQKNGDYDVENINAFGEIGFGVVTYDRQDYAPNKNGVSNIQTFYNGQKRLEIDFKRFSFSETKHIKRLIDYEYYKTKKSRIQKLFVEPNNPLSLYKDAYDNGYVRVEDSTASIYKIRIRDFAGNESWISIPIAGIYETLSPTSEVVTTAKTTIPYNRSLNLSDEDITVSFYKNTVYEDTSIDYRVHCDTLFLGEDTVPLQKNFYINYDISDFKTEDQDKLFIARLYGYYKKPTYLKTTRKGNVLSAGSKVLGTFTLATDTTPPTVRPINFTNKKWLSKYRYLKLKIDDDISGISNYRATVNGKWILMEYDYKTGMLVHDFNDNVVKDTKNEFKLIVTDNVGNSTTFEAIFYRK